MLWKIQTANKQPSPIIHCVYPQEGNTGGGKDEQYYSQINGTGVTVWTLMRGAQECVEKLHCPCQVCTSFTTGEHKGMTAKILSMIVKLESPVLTWKRVEKWELRGEGRWRLHILTIDIIWESFECRVNTFSYLMSNYCFKELGSSVKWQSSEDWPAQNDFSLYNERRICD